MAIKTPAPSSTSELPGADEPASRRTAANHVHDVLERMVVTGALKPGHRLTETALAEKLNVSRTPLRQAIGRLENNGWIERSVTGAIRVMDVSERDIQALYAVRAALEELIVAQAAKRLDSAGYRALRRILELQDQAARSDNANLVSAYGEAFHRALWRHSDNAVAIQFLEQVLMRTTRYRRLSFAEPYRFREGSRQHWRILDALEGGDVTRAVTLLRRHVAESRKYVLQAFRSWQRSRQLDAATNGHRPARSSRRVA